MADTPSPDMGRLRLRAAEEIRVMLARRRMSGSELARRTGIPQSNMSRRLNGDLPFDLDELELVAAVLEVSLVDLIPETARAAPALDEEEIKSGPLRSRPIRHPRSAVKPTTPYLPVPERMIYARPPGRPAKSMPSPTTRRPAFV